MVAHEIEIYRGFHVRMTMTETRTHWVCNCAFVRWDGKGHKAVPPEFEETADKMEIGALSFCMAMQSKARALIDDWLAGRCS